MIKSLHKINQIKIISGPSIFHVLEIILDSFHEDGQFAVVLKFV